MNYRPLTAHMDAPDDVGTLWTMRRPGRQARCALFARPGSWELRILIDGDVLLAERCPRGNDAFALAARWKDRMLAQGWEQVVPNSTRPCPRAVSRRATPRPSSAG
jgi:hypothetical protein